MVIASERSYPTKRVCPILKPSSVSLWTQTRFLTIRIVALTGVWELHPTKRFATDCLNRSAAHGRKSSVSCFAHKKSAEDRNHLLRRQVSTRGRALCGAQIRNVRPVLVRTFRGYKIANRALLHRVTVPSNGSRRWDNRGGDQDISIK